MKVLYTRYSNPLLNRSTRPNAWEISRNEGVLVRYNSDTAYGRDATPTRYVCFTFFWGSILEL